MTDLTAASATLNRTVHAIDWRPPADDEPGTIRVMMEGTTTTAFATTKREAWDRVVGMVTGRMVA